MDTNHFNYELFITKVNAKVGSPKAKWVDYIEYYKALMFAIHERYVPNTPPSNGSIFYSAVEHWAYWIGYRRSQYNNDDYTDEDLCQWFIWELDGTRENVSKRLDAAHTTIITQFPLQWDKLTPEENRALQYATLRICLIPFNAGGFGTRQLKRGERMPQVQKVKLGMEDKEIVKSLEFMTKLVQEYEKLDAQLEKNKRLEKARLSAFKWTKEDEARIDKLSREMPQEPSAQVLPDSAIGTMKKPEIMHVEVGEM